jgi:hypothetical protein
MVVLAAWIHMAYKFAHVHLVSLELLVNILLVALIHHAKMEAHALIKHLTAELSVVNARVTFYWNIYSWRLLLIFIKFILANFYGQDCSYSITAQTCSSPDMNTTSCQNWKALGFCSFSYTFNLIPVPIYCPQSCSLCTSISTCTDSQTNCALWASLNLCSKVNSLNPNLCVKSCGTCVSISRSILSRSNETRIIDLSSL